jgi:protein SCO1/2
MNGYLSLLALYLLPVAAATAVPVDANTRPAALRDVGIEQHLDSQLPLDVVLRDETGKAVSLGQYFGKRPVILNFVYHNCPMLCPTAMDGLIQSLNSLSFDAGKEFEVVIVSFDPADTSAVAASKKTEYLHRYRRDGGAAGWHFLTGEAPALRKLTEAAGFHYNYDAETKQFSHAAGIMIVTPHGKLARYFYGIQFPQRDLRLSLVEASANKIGSTVDQVLLFCSRFDSHTGKYSLVVMKVIQLAGLATVLVLGTVLGVFLWRENHSAARIAPLEPQAAAAGKEGG